MCLLSYTTWSPISWLGVSQLCRITMQIRKSFEFSRILGYLSVDHKFFLPTQQKFLKWYKPGFMGGLFCAVKVYHMLLMRCVLFQVSFHDYPMLSWHFTKYYGRIWTDTFSKTIYSIFSSLCGLIYNCYFCKFPIVALLEQLWQFTPPFVVAWDDCFSIALPRCREQGIHFLNYF